jgi:chemotaxis protein methyltransferase CheR
VDHILDTVFAERGYDFHNYQRAFVMRRLAGVAKQRGMADVLELASRIWEEPGLSSAIIESLTVGVTEMFRDPPFWASLREQLSVLDASDVLRCWVAGCATGEEAYSLTILLREAGFEGRYLIYATDISESALAESRHRRIMACDLDVVEDNYRLSGGTGVLADHYQDDSSGGALIDHSIVFARHNLATDAMFNSFHIVLCRNVMIYFDADLHRRAHALIHDSLLPGGLLGLGSRESVMGSGHRAWYEAVDKPNRIYRRLP